MDANNNTRKICVSRNDMYCTRALTHVVTQSAFDKALQLKPWYYLCGCHHIQKICTLCTLSKLNLRGCDGDLIREREQTYVGLYVSQVRSLFVCSTQGTTCLLTSIYHVLVLTCKHYYSMYLNAVVHSIAYHRYMGKF